MELRPGYKKTEVGIIPEEWQASRLDEVAKRGSGHTPDKGHPEYWDGDINWISLADSDALDDLYISDTSATITALGIANSSAVLHPAGTVVMSRDAGIGKSAIMSSAMAVSQHFMAWRCGPRLDNTFLYYWLQHEKPEFERIGNGSTIKTIGLPYFRDLKIPLPPLREQQAIAAVLREVDAALSALDQLIAKKRDLKQGAMQQLLTGQNRLEGFGGEWRTKTINEMGEVLAGKALDVNGPGRLRSYLRTKNVLDGCINIGDVLEMPMTDSEFATFLIEDGDLLLNEGQSLELVGRCAMYRGELGRPCAMQNQLLRFRARPGTSPAFAEQLFRRCQQVGIFAAIATQTTSVAHLGSERFKALRLPWPSDPEEQSAIAEVLADMDSELAMLEQCRNKTRNLKQAMMHELLTGKTRLV